MQSDANPPLALQEAPIDVVRGFLAREDPAFWPSLREATRNATDFSAVMSLATMRKKGDRRAIAGKSEYPIRVAMMGGCSLYPLHELVQHMVSAGCPFGWWNVELWLGDYDNYVSEMLDADSALYTFKPDVIFLVPSNQRCRYVGALTDTREQQEAQVVVDVQELLDLCRVAHDRSGAEIVVSNFMPSADSDPGAYRVRTLGSDWNFRKRMNLELGLSAPSYVHICDVEFMASRRGSASCFDARAWFETKQLYSPAFAPDVARAVASLVASLHKPAKKVLALDLDNTLWGGVIGDDGMTGIEIGGTSARGEAFKAFQESIATLASRGVVLAVCSKNEHDTATEPFEKHPEMVLRLKDIASFQANWEPKSDNLRRIATELNLGLDSIVFVDDNPAEVEIVRQFAPEIETILLGPDPAGYASQLLNCGFFDPRSITSDDLKRGEQYQQQAARAQMLGSHADMKAYLASLEMRSEISEFTPVDVPRISQLINKSNQFNVTTRRRSEAEVEGLLADDNHFAISARLADKFGDNGLISVVVAEVLDDTATIDTWLMSCRVLKRQMEEEVLNEIVRLAALRGCTTIIGHYLPTEKNAMVRDLFPRMGFTLTGETAERATFELDIAGFVPRATCIQMDRRAYDPR
jgi:FkbH-like protein